MQELLPPGSSFMRPYLSLNARNRLREREPEALAALAGVALAPSTLVPGGLSILTSSSGPTLSLRLPIGSQAPHSLLKLTEGDMLHVPFTRAEATVLRSAMVEHGTPLDARCSMPSWLRRDASRLLPGRTAEDCWRFMQSGELAALLVARTPSSDSASAEANLAPPANAMVAVRGCCEPQHYRPAATTIHRVAKPSSRKPLLPPTVALLPQRHRWRRNPRQSERADVATEAIRRHYCIRSTARALAPVYEPTHLSPYARRSGTHSIGASVPTRSQRSPRAT